MILKSQQTDWVGRGAPKAKKKFSKVSVQVHVLYKVTLESSFEHVRHILQHIFLLHITTRITATHITTHITTH
jgi:hypothetical protein